MLLCFHFLCKKNIEIHAEFYCDRYIGLLQYGYGESDKLN